MTLVNWISIGIVGAVIIAGVVLVICYTRKIRNLDGFMGIIQAEPEELEVAEKK